MQFPTWINKQINTSLYTRLHRDRVLWWLWMSIKSYRLCIYIYIKNTHLSDTCLSRARPWLAGFPNLHWERKKGPKIGARPFKGRRGSIWIKSQPHLPCFMYQWQFKWTKLSWLTLRKCKTLERELLSTAACQHQNQRHSPEFHAIMNPLNLSQTSNHINSITFYLQTLSAILDHRES